MRELPARSLHAGAWNCFAVSKGLPNSIDAQSEREQTATEETSCLLVTAAKFPLFLELKICFAGVSLSRIRESEMLGTGIYTVKQLFVTLSRALWRWEYSPGVRRSAWHL